MKMCVPQEVECETVAPGSVRVPRYPTIKKNLPASKEPVLFGFVLKGY